MTFIYSLPVLLLLVLAGALGFNLLRLFLLIPVSLLQQRLGLTDEQVVRVNDSLTAGVLVAAMFFLQLVEPPR